MEYLTNCIEDAKNKVRYYTSQLRQECTHNRLSLVDLGPVVLPYQHHVVEHVVCFDCGLVEEESIEDSHEYDYDWFPPKSDSMHLTQEMTCSELFADVHHTIVETTGLIDDIGPIVMSYLLQCGMDACDETCYLKDSQERLKQRTKELKLKPVMPFRTSWVSLGPIVVGPIIS
jgi:hypothetical protein